MIESLTYRWERVRQAFVEHGVRRAVYVACRQASVDCRELAIQVRGRLGHGDRIVLRNTDVGQMFLDVREKGVSRQLIRDGTREPHLVHLLRQELKPGMQGMDIGSNIGYYVLLEAELVGSEGRVIACEPVPHTVDLLRRNVSLHAHRHVDVLPVAASDTVGEVEMHTSNAWNTASIGASDGRGARRKVRVRADTADNLVEETDLRRVDFVRMDIEGHEMYATRGMHRILASGAPLKMFIEVHNPRNGLSGDDVAEWLKGLMREGLRPKAFSVGTRFQWVDDENKFTREVCSRLRACPHIYLAR